MQSSAEIVKKFARSILEFIEHIKLRNILKFEKSSTPKLMYAGMVPEQGKAASGGAVKLLEMVKEFPECGYKGNILYLVTSCLPFAAVAWAKAAKNAGISIVLNQNGVAYPAWATVSEMQRINKRNQQLLQLADHVIFQSKFCQQSCEKWVGKYYKQASIIYNPIDTEKFTLSNDLQKSRDIIIMGSHSQPERVMLALDLLSYAKKNGLLLKLGIAGRLLWENADLEIRKYIELHNLVGMVELMGAYKPEEAPKIYQSSRMLLHLQDKDASPTVPLEAMACGVPIIGINSGGLPELVKNSLGALLPVDNSWEKYHYPSVKLIFEELQKILLQNKAEREKNIRQHIVENFSSSIFMEKHRTVFSSLRNQ